MPYKNPEDNTRQSRRYRAARKQALGTDAPFVKPFVNVKIPVPKHGLKIAVIPDCQVRPGVPLKHLEAAGRYIAAKRPDVIIQIGDFTDLASLSRHDEKGSLALEGKRYIKDCQVAQEAMALLMNPILREHDYAPRLLMTLGNHEHRIERLVKNDPKLEGLIKLEDLKYKEFGWEVYPFLQPIVVGGVAFCHYFPSGVMGHPITQARQLLTKLHMSAFAGHQQGRDIAYSRRADGGDLTAIISGSFYQHQEEYLSPFTNNHWRGMYFLHQVRDGRFDEMALSLDYLLRRYDGKLPNQG